MPLAASETFGAKPLVNELHYQINVVLQNYRYFNTTARMTKLFMKITNQLIESCKDAINGQEAPDKIWDLDPGPLLELLEQTLRYNSRCNDDEYV